MDALPFYVLLVDCHGYDTASPGVGAHALHLTASSTHGAVACDQCHPVPATWDAPGHIDNTRPADLLFGTLASAGGRTPTYDGSSSNPAPPTDLQGLSDTSRPGVGAHQAHLSGGAFSRPLECSECHVVPAVGAGHPDAWTTATVQFSGPATTRGHAPTWDRAAGSCTDTWCHGPDQIGALSPSWTGGPANLTCTSCHGMPPPEPHVQIAQCYLCHTDVDANNTITNRALHANGQADF